MSNRIFFYLIMMTLMGIGILFFFNLTPLLGRHEGPETYLKYNEIRGIAVQHHQLLYTLNFAQQNQLIDLLNHSVKITDFTGDIQKPDIEKIIIYRFRGAEDLVINPISYVDENLVYFIPEWNPNGYLMDISGGQLQTLLSQTYDN